MIQLGPVFLLLLGIIATHCMGMLANVAHELTKRYYSYTMHIYYIMYTGTRNTLH